MQVNIKEWMSKLGLTFDSDFAWVESIRIHQEKILILELSLLRSTNIDELETIKKKLLSVYSMDLILTIKPDPSFVLTEEWISWAFQDLKALHSSFSKLSYTLEHNTLVLDTSDSLLISDQKAKLISLFIQKKLNQDISVLWKQKPKQLSGQNGHLNNRVELHASFNPDLKGGYSLDDILDILGKNGEEGAVLICDIKDLDTLSKQVYEDLSNSDKKMGVGVKLNVSNTQGYCVFGDVSVSDITSFVAFDVETTGLTAQDNRVIEIGAARFEKTENGLFEPVAFFNKLLNHQVVIPPKITEITGITTDMVYTEGEDPAQVMKAFLAFIGSDVLCAHNAPFDLDFIRYEVERCLGSEASLTFNPTLVDTLPLARSSWPGLPSYTLDKICGFLNIILENHHRAENDAEACGYILARVLNQNPAIALQSLNDRIWNKSQNTTEPFTMTLVVSNTLGLVNLKRLLSLNQETYTYGQIRYYQAGLILGSPYDQGEVMNLYRKLYEEAGHDLDKIQQTFTKTFRFIFRRYNYIEALPGDPVAESFYNLFHAQRRSEASLCASNYPQVVQEECKLLYELLVGQGNLWLSTTDFLGRFDERTDYIMDMVVHRPKHILERIDMPGQFQKA